jgi:hypothetical protein
MLFMAQGKQSLLVRAGRLMIGQMTFDGRP